MELEAQPKGVMDIEVGRLSSKGMAIANLILQAVKDSPVIVSQLLQQTAVVPENVMNGVLSSKEIGLRGHYQAVQCFDDSQAHRALYMHNKSLIEVVGPDLVHSLYKAVQPLKQDVLVNYPLLYISDNPKSSNDVLVGSAGSWSPLHQDLPLYCTSAILVLEGHKEFVVVPDDVAPSLRVNLSSGCWDQKITHQGQTYPDLQSLVRATGGVVLSLRAGDLMVMPPRYFHLARNCAPTVSCNFSVCSMDHVPLTLAQTLQRIEQSPCDVMHFDSDFARLLGDCTKALLHQTQVRASTINKLTSRKRLPAVTSVLDKSVRLMEWYMSLQCIPAGWVEGFWGGVRDRLLEQMQAALPLHNRSDGLATSGGPVKGAAAAGPAADAAGLEALPASVPRPLSTGRAVGQKAEPRTQQQQQQEEGSRRCTRAGAAAAAAAVAAAAATDGGGAAGAEPLLQHAAKRARLLGGQGGAPAVVVAR